jgi:voltage-gated potassium channel
MIRKPGYVFGVDNSIFLLISIIAFVFIFPAIDIKFIHDLFVTIAYTLVLISIFSIIESKTKWMRYVIAVAIIANITLIFVFDEFVIAGVFSISAITFTIATGILIKHIAVSKDVSVAIIIQALCGYMLIGIIGVLLNAILIGFNENAISVGNDERFSALIYYSFITLTTIGYGEIVPQSIEARSVSILIGVCGQLYLTIIIAMIVGKYLNLGRKK